MPPPPMPIISIITPLYNKGAYISETIESVLSQLLPDWELIIVDNGSADNGPEVVRMFADARIRLVASPKRGPGAARNYGLTVASGEWILFLDADDLLAPDYLQERLGLLQNHPLADLLVGGWEEFEDGALEHKIIRRPAALGGTAQDLADAAIAFAPWALHAAIMRKSRLRQAPWAEHLDTLPYEDAAFWFPVVCDSSPAWTESAGALYRVQTFDSRNKIVSAERALHGVIGAVTENVNHLKTLGHQPNANQTGNLVRTFEAAYRMALRMRNRAAASVALEHAQYWLHQLPPTGASMKLRRSLGLRLFNLLRFGVI